MRQEHEGVAFVTDAKDELLGLLDRKVFDPTIHARASGYPADRRRVLENVQRTARHTQAAYHQYGSAEHIKSMFKDDLRSPDGKRQTEELHALGLPAFPDVENDFMELVEKHHVS